jgi:hypothetical protein
LKKSLSYFPITICILLFGCGASSDNNTELLKARYTAEVLNYFYEVALHSEVPTNKLSSVQKWQNDIYLFINGDTLEGDRLLVRNVINQLNVLKLPITFYETSQANKANFFITFEPLKKKLQRVTGTGTIYAAKGVIFHAKVKIFYDSIEAVTKKERFDTIFEETTQCLGLPGDSYAYPESMFYQDINYIQRLTELDKQLLQLLYEPAIVANYSLAQFEKDFDEILYNINGKQKFINFIKVLNPSEESLQNIFKYGLSKDPRDGKEKISKYHYPTYILVKGDYTQEFINVLNETISEINTISENLKLILIDDDSLLHTGGIHFNFVKNPQMTQDSALWEAKHLIGSIIPRNSKNEITFKYRDHDKLMENIRKAIPNLIYKSVCLTNANEANFFDFNNTGFQLKPLYRETLRVYYDNSLPAGFTKEDLEEVIQEYTNYK